MSTEKTLPTAPVDAVVIGPVYGVPLISKLPLGAGSMLQAMPNRRDLQLARQVSERTAAGYEVLLDHYRKQCEEVDRLKALCREVIKGNWSVTGLQEAIGDLSR